LRLETSFPEQPIGDGDGFRGVTIVHTRGWLDDGDVEVNKALSTLLWQNIEWKIGRREQLPGTQLDAELLVMTPRR
jgi:hypothetical protein